MIAHSGNFKRSYSTNYLTATVDATATSDWDDIYEIAQYIMIQPSNNGKKKRHYFDVISEKKTWQHIQQEHTKVKVKTERLGDFG